MKGIIINDEIKLDTGVLINDAFCSVGLSVLKLQQQNDGNFVMVAVMSFYKNVDAYDAGLATLKQEYVSIPDIPYQALSVSNPYVVAYDYMKAQYVSTVDVNL